MKLSTILFMAAFLLFIGTLAAHNYSLKAAYLSGNHKKRFNDHRFMALKGVHELEIKTGNVFSIEVEYGTEEGIWLSNRIKDEVKVLQNGQKVTIDLVMNEKNREFGNNASEFVIVLNHLNKVQTYNYSKYDEMISGRVGTLYIKNLKERDFDVTLGDQFSFTIDSCTFGSLYAVVGEKGKNSTLQVTNDNKIDTATFDIRGGNFLELNNSEISRLNYKLSDSSRVFMTGKSIKALKNRM